MNLPGTKDPKKDHFSVGLDFVVDLDSGQFGVTPVTPKMPGPLFFAHLLIGHFVLSSLFCYEAPLQHN